MVPLEVQYTSTGQGYINAEVAKHIDEVQIYEMNQNLQKAIAAEDQAAVERVAQQIEKYRRAEYHYVHLDVPDSDRWAGVLFAELCVGQPYGRLSFLALGLAALTRRQLQIQDPRRQHCVSLVIRALERMRGEFGREALDMMPADLAKHYNITPRSEPDPTWHR